MITKIQSSQTQQPAFTANWKQARAVIESLPQEHRFFQGLNYTLDNKTIATKEVLLTRLDKFAEVLKNKTFKNTTFNLDMPDFSSFFKNPKKFWGGIREQYLLGHFEPPYSTGFEYPFERTIMENGGKRLTTLKTDSVGNVATFLLEKGKSLSAELKKAGLENPKEIVFVKNIAEYKTPAQEMDDYFMYKMTGIK